VLWITPEISDVLSRWQTAQNSLHGAPEGPRQPLARLMALISWVAERSLIGLWPMHGKDNRRACAVRELFYSVQPGDVVVADRFHCTTGTLAISRWLNRALPTRLRSCSPKDSYPCHGTSPQRSSAIHEPLPADSTGAQALRGRDATAPRSGAFRAFWQGAVLAGKRPARRMARRPRRS